MVGRLLLALVLLGAWAGTSHAQTTTTDRLAALERVVVGSGTFGTTSPWQVVGLPAKTSQTACAWLDANGNVFTGACPTGTVTSVGLSMPGMFSVANSPVTTAGTLTVTLANQNANLVFAGPSSGGAAAPTFRTLVAGDFGTGIAQSAVLIGPSGSSGAATFRTLVDADVPDNLTLGTVSGNPTFTGNVTLGDATSDTWSLTSRLATDMLPNTGYSRSLGSASLKLLSVHAGELLVDTLVARDVVATIGGRVVVAPTTLLTANLVAAATTMTVKHNNLTLAGGGACSGGSPCPVLLQGNGNVEWVDVTSAAGGSAGAYTYTITRNRDGSGANDWYAGDAVVLTHGFIDLYSEAGLKSGSEVGPTIVGNVRLSSTYNDFAPRWAIGNLSALYGYGATDCGGGPCYGAAFGNPSGANLVVDGTNGIRLRSTTTTRAQLSGTTLTLGESGGTRAEITSSGMDIYDDGNIKRVTVDVNAVRLHGGTAGSNPQVVLDTANGLRITNSSGAVVFQSDTSGNTTITGRLVVQGDGWNAPGGGNLLRNSQPSSVCGSGPCWYPYNNTSGSEPTTSWGAYCGAANATPVGSCFFYHNWTGTNTSTKGILASGGIPWVNVGGASYGTWRKGQWYTVSWWANFGGTGGTGMVLAWNTAPSYVVTLMNPTLSGGGWQRYAYAIYWSPGATANNELYITLTGSAGGGELQIAGLQVEHGAVPSGYQPSDQCSGCIVADSIEATAIDGKTITGSTMRHTNLDADSYHRRWQLDGDGLAFGVGSGSGDLGNTLRFLSSGTRVSQFGYWNSTAHWWGGAAPTILIGAQSEATYGTNEDPVIKLRSNNSNSTPPRYAWLDVDGPNGRINLHGANQGVFITQDDTPVSRVHSDTDLVVEQNIEGKGLYITNWASGGSDHLCRNASATAAWITVCSSSARYKQDIVPAREDWARILDVTPMQYHWRTQPTAPLELGAIAEDVDALGLPALVRYDERGRPDGLRYERMALYLIPLVKEQRERIASLEQRLAALEVQVAAQQPKSGPDAFYPVYRGGPLPEGALTRTCSCTLGIPPVCACDPAPVPILMKGHP